MSLLRSEHATEEDAPEVGGAEGVASLGVGGAEGEAEEDSPVVGGDAEEEDSLFKDSDEEESSPPKKKQKLDEGTYLLDLYLNY